MSDAVTVTLYLPDREDGSRPLGNFLALHGAIPVTGDFVWHSDCRDEGGVPRGWQVIARLHRPPAAGTWPDVHVHESVDLLVAPAPEDPFTTTGGRRPRHRGGTKLNESDVVRIRTRYSDGEKQRSIAAEYGVSQGSISDIVNGRAWRHVEGPITRGRLGRRRVDKKEAGDGRRHHDHRDRQPDR